MQMPLRPKTKMTCPHSWIEQETAVNRDGDCPICLKESNKKLWESLSMLDEYCAFVGISPQVAVRQAAMENIKRFNPFSEEKLK